MLGVCDEQESFSGFVREACATLDGIHAELVTYRGELPVFPYKEFALWQIVKLRNPKSGSMLPSAN
jgi:hypothetical protein